MALLLLKLTLVAYAGLLGLLYTLQGSMVFPATRGGGAVTPREFGWSYEEVTLPVEGETTRGVWLPVEDARGAILFSHGNGGNIDLWLDAMAPYRRLGFSVLLYDYGGYGLSTGRPSERRCRADALAMWRWLTDAQGIAPERTALIGRSLGSAVAAQLATEVKPGAVVLESPFLSLARMARKLYPFVPARFLLRHRFDTEAKVGRIDAPVLIIHSRDDKLVPFEHGRRLYELAHEPKQFLEIPGGHNDAFTLSEDAYVDGLKDFLERFFPPAPADQ